MTTAPRLKLHYHPLSSFCQKVLVALYEQGTPFEPVFVDLGDPAHRAALEKLWPFVRFPVLEDLDAGRAVPESSIIIEYLEQRSPGPEPLLPSDPDAALRTRLQDRFFDIYVHHAMQKITGDRLRPAEARDPFGVEHARGLIRTAYGMIERDMAAKTWAMGETFTLADCSACPALFYADWCIPLEGEWPNTAAYLARLKARPSFARVIEEAKPWWKFFPQEEGDVAPV
ncbi:MAG TPA: glutathione S-transferase family protein [Caulobacteraceae bacterium]|jgi:glutathione S-transferase